MCTIAIGLGVAALASSVAGTVVSARNQASVASAQMNAATEAQRAQDTSFWERNAAQSQENQATAATQEQAIQSEEQAAAQQQQQQNQALTQQQQVIEEQNAASQNVGQRAQALVSQAETAASPQAAAAAAQKQQQDVANLTASAYQGVTGQSLDPNAPASTAATGATPDSETASAIATRLAQAATNTRNYAGATGTLASYGAPLNLFATTAQNLGTQTQPLNLQEKTVQTATPALLLPSQVAYTSAGNYYKNLLNAIQARTQGQLNVSNAAYQGEINLADLAQADSVTQAQNQAAIAQYNAAMNPTSAILSGAGQVGMYGAGAMGGPTIGSMARNAAGYIADIFTGAGPASDAIT